MTAVLEPVAPLLGSTTPRLGTPPLVDGPPGPCGCGCALTPASSLGFEAEAFAIQVLSIALLPWQRHWLIHALELRPDGGYRFRTVLTLVGRQNGKTTLCKVLALWAMYLGHARMVLGAAQSLDIAREAWAGAVELAEDVPDLADEIAPNGIRRANGEQCLTLSSGARYRIAAATRGAGRGLSVDLLVLDELREQRNTDAWAALSKTTMARPRALIVGISNAGDDESVVLNALRSAALAGADDTIGLFEWSAPDGCELDDMHAVAQACPGLGRTITESAVRSALATDTPAVFRCLDVSTQILTARGWSNMGALTVGDQVKGTSGAWVDVVGISPTHHGKPCYRITFNDGRSIVCDEEHLWTVRDRRRPRAELETLRTVDLIERGVTYRNPSMAYDVRNFALPEVAPLDGPDVALPLDPYLLGLWLGDGAMRNANVFVEDRDVEHVVETLRSRDVDVIRQARDSAHCYRLSTQVRGRRGNVTAALHELGVHSNKHVPDLYLTASQEQRLWLLRGLMDSDDGTVSARSGRCVFTNTNDKLVTGVRTLIRSLGWKTSDREPGRYGLEHWLPRFDVSFTVRPDQAVPVTIPRKAANIRAARAGHRDVRPVTIVSIEPVPSVPVRCIEVDAPDSLFLAGDLVPTHNTEVLCQHVEALDAAVDPAGWEACADRTGSLESVRERLVLCVDVAPDGRHVTLVGSAPLDDGRVRSEVMGAWTSTEDARAGTRTSPSLLSIIAKVRPRAVGYFPSGPGAVFGVDLAEQHGVTIGQLTLRKDALQPYAPGLVELTGSTVPELCQTAADLVQSRQALHPDDPLLNAHVAGSQRHRLGDGWRFARKGVGHVDAAYAWAGSVHLARSLPLPAPPPRSQVF